MNLKNKKIILILFISGILVCWKTKNQEIKIIKDRIMSLS